MRNLLQVALAVLLWVAGASAVRGQAPPSYSDAKSLVAGIQDKLKTITDYSLVAYVQDPHRELVVDYQCVRPSNIRTEILDGSNRGIVVVYLPDVKDKMVKVKAGNKRMWRSIDKLKIGGSPLVESVLDKFDSDLAQYSFTMKSHQKVSVEVGKAIKVKSDSEADSMLGDDRELQRTTPEPPSTKFNHETVDKDCYVLAGSKGDIRVELAVDSETLWPVSIKRWKSNKPDFTAQIWRLTTNTSPKIDL